MAEQVESLQSTTKQVDINIKEKAQSDNTTLNFKDSGFLKNYVQQPTAVPTPSIDTTSTAPKETVEEIRQKMLKEEEDESKKMTVEDFEDVADFLIDAFDMLAVFLLRWYAQDTSDAPYQIPVDRMKKLKHRLSRLLMRMQAKFPLGFLFIIGLILAYASPMKKARDHRKEVMANKKKALPPAPPKATPSAAPKAPSSTPAPKAPAAPKEPVAPKVPAAPPPQIISVDEINAAREAMQEASHQPATSEVPKKPRGRPSK